MTRHILYGVPLSTMILWTIALAQPAGPPRLGDDRRAGGPPRVGDDRGASGQARTPGVAQPSGTEGGQPGEDRDRGHRHRRGFGGGRGQEIDPSVLDPKVLEKELKLEWNQKQEIEQIFREYEAAMADVRRKATDQQGQREKERLEQELKTARMARDTRRAEEIWEKLRDLRTDVSEEEREMREILIEEIEKALNEGQKTQFRRMLRPNAPGSGPATGPLDDPAVLFQCVQQVKLQDYQKPQLEQIKKQYEEEMQRRSQGGVKMSPEEEKIMRKRLLDDVLMVLDDQQEKQLKEVHSRMSGPGGGGGTIDMKNMGQLRFAIYRLSSTSHRLTQQQQTELQQVDSEYRQQLRNVMSDAQARQRLDEEFADKVANLLTPEQKEEISKMQAPAGRFGGGRSMERPGGMTTPGGVSTPGGMTPPPPPPPGAPTNVPAWNR